MPSEHAANKHAGFDCHSWPADPYTASSGDLLSGPVAFDGAVGPSVLWE